MTNPIPNPSKSTSPSANLTLTTQGFLGAAREVLTQMGVVL